jgi:hypothetical protein
VPTIRSTILAVVVALFAVGALSAAPAGAQPVVPGPSGYYARGYYGCSEIFLELARKNGELARIRASLRRLETETDDTLRARQWIRALEAENQNLRQQNALFQRRLIELEAELNASRSTTSEGGNR